MYKLVGFDLDGTIVNSLDDLYNAVNYALAKENLKLREKHEIRSFIGNGILKLLERSMSSESCVDDECTLRKLKSHFDEYYSEHYCDETKPYDGIVELFKSLQEKGVGMFIFSNKQVDYVEVIAKKLFAGIEFKALLGGCEQFPSKPQPDNFLSFAKRENIDLSKCIYVGDSNVDIQFSKNANIKSVGVLWGYMDKQAVESQNPDFIASTVKELEQVLLQD